MWQSLLVRVGFAACALFILAEGSASATPTYTLTGSRSSPSGDGITATAQWNNGGFTLGWKITYDSSSMLWTYNYKITGDAKDLSHWIMEVSRPDGDGVVAIDDIVVSSGQAVTPPTKYSTNGNPGIPGTIYGIKWDNTTGTVNTFSFTTARRPMWGDFYAKDGREGGPDGVDVIAYNTGFGNEAPDLYNYGANYTNWILVPDSEDGPPDFGTVVPEPSSIAMALMALVPLGFAGLRRLRRRTATPMA